MRRSNTGSRTRPGGRLALSGLAAVLVALTILAAASTRPAGAQVPFSFFEAAAEADVVYLSGDAPGLLPISPVLEIGVGYAKSTMAVAQNHAVASPLYPGGVITGLPSILELVGVKVPFGIQLRDNFYLNWGESYFPDGGTSKAAPLQGSFFGIVKFENGTGEATTAADAALSSATLAAGEIAGLFRAEGIKSSANTRVENGAVVATATTEVARLSIGSSIVLEGVTATATDASNAEPSGDVKVKGCRAGGVRCILTSSGLRFPANSDPREPVVDLGFALLGNFGAELRLGRPTITEAGADVAALEAVLSIPLEQPRPGIPRQQAQVILKVGRAKASASASGPIKIVPTTAPKSSGGQASDGGPTHTVAVGRVANLGPGIALGVGTLGTVAGLAALSTIGAPARRRGRRHSPND